MRAPAPRPASRDAMAARVALSQSKGFVLKISPRLRGVKLCVEYATRPSPSGILTDRRGDRIEPPGKRLVSNPAPLLSASRPRKALTLRFTRRIRVSTNHRIVKEPRARRPGPGAWPGGEAVAKTAPPRAQEAKAERPRRPPGVFRRRAGDACLDRSWPPARGCEAGGSRAARPAVEGVTLTGAAARCKKMVRFQTANS